MKRAHAPAVLCPCGSGRTLDACCGPYLSGAALPPDAETLMRSRYSAYTLHNAAYLLATWHPATRPASLDLGEPPMPKWLGLEVRQHSQVDADHATVEFVARYKVGGRGHRLHERSRFERVAGHWHYLDGEISATP
ncbi:MAG: SEC-C domain-containing protein [Hydrogenophilaceae bacterium]|nr:SEC-C domain-containing protein [Hydrogenophilaceae bacterium]